MRDDTASGRVLLTALDRLKHIQVVQHILDAAVIGQSVEERPHCLLGLQPVILLQPNTLLLPPFYRKQPPRSDPSSQIVLLHANAQHQLRAKRVGCMLGLGDEPVQTGYIGNTSNREHG
jgi:hypothetical protein